MIWNFRKRIEDIKNVMLYVREDHGESTRSIFGKEEGTMMDLSKGIFQVLRALI